MWKGYYEQFGSQHPMQFKNFRAHPLPGGPIEGDGVDQISTFKFSGTFSPDALRVRFIKQYYGKANHAIYYQGDVKQNPPTIEGFYGFSPGQ